MAMTLEDQHPIVNFFRGEIPDDWFTGPCDVRADTHEILVVGDLPDDADVSAFRERTREARVAVASRAEAAFRRKVSWGVRAGGEDLRFTGLGVPVMTRLRFSEREVLDTLVEAGVARSRSDALAWCVRLVGKNAESWLGDLREAMRQVERVRADGPDAS